MNEEMKKELEIEIERYGRFIEETESCSVVDKMYLRHLKGINMGLMKAFYILQQEVS